jgi:hypothetical protein
LDSNADEKVETRWNQNTNGGEGIVTNDNDYSSNYDPDVKRTDFKRSEVRPRWIEDRQVSPYSPGQSRLCRRDSKSRHFGELVRFDLLDQEAPDFCSKIAQRSKDSKTLR